jgi:superfamily II DNA or RNA helicase
MTSLILETPTKLRIPTDSVGMVEDILKYEQKSATQEWLRWHKIQKADDFFLLNNNPRAIRNWFVLKYGREYLDEKVKELNSSRFKTLLLKDEKGYYTHSGLATRLSKLFNLTPERQYILPERGLVPWANKPTQIPRWYQSKSVELLCPDDYSRGHGAISLATGAGKSLVLGVLAHKIGLPTLIITPNLSIASQLLKSFKFWFGEGKVGQYFKGKKQPEKLIVVSVAASLARVKEGSKDWDILSSKKVILGDECHLTPPQQLRGIIFGLLENVPYRYWVSGTVFRNDGLELLLEGIVGDVVFKMTVEDCVKEGFLSPLKFFQYKTTSDSTKRVEDSIEATREHLHRNPRVYKHAASLINYAVTEKNRRVLVQVDTLDQFKRLLDGGLKVKAQFAHGGCTSANKGNVPEEYRKSDPNKLVEQFDKGEFPVLVGTSVIGTGSDICSCDFIVNLIGLGSEIEICQNAGRGTRLSPATNKKECFYIDYDVSNIECLTKHSAKRRKIFNSIYGNCTRLDAKN